MMMKREIGSEFWNIPLTNKGNKIFPEHTAFFMSGRGALYSVIEDVLKTRKINSVAMPSWCCDSMIIPFLKKGISVKFYPVYTENGKISFEFDKAECCDAVLVMDYFGYDCHTDMSGFGGIVIRDLTHSIFTKKHNDADYYFGSLRKWAGFCTGGFAYKKNGSFCDVCGLKKDDYYINLRKCMMTEKDAYISGICDSKEYLKKNTEAEEYLEKHYCGAADNSDIENAHRLDVLYIKEKRRDNARTLINHFYDIAIFNEIKEDDCPLFVPIRLPKEERDSIRTELIKRQIYLPVHWNITEYHKITNKEEEIYDCELSLVCDQRYDCEDMEKMAATIKEVWRSKL